VAQIRPLAEKIFYSSKAALHIYSHTKFEPDVASIIVWLQDHCIL